MDGNAACGEKTAEKMIRLYSETVYRLAYARTGSREDADDVFGEVFLRYVKKMPEFDSEEHEKAWFLRVTINCANSLFASPWRRHRAVLNENIPAPEPRERVSLEKYLAGLGAREREVVHLFYYEDMPSAEIARLLGRPETTVRSQLSRARARLKELMGDDYNDR